MTPFTGKLINIDIEHEYDLLVNVVLSLALYRMLKSMELLPFDRPAEIFVVRSSSMVPKVFVSTSAGTRTRDLPHSNRML